MRHTGKDTRFSILSVAALLLPLLSLASCGSSNGGSTPVSSGFNLSATSLTFSYQLGITPAAPNPQQQITVSSSGSSAVSFAVTTDQTWIVVLPSNAITPATLTITATPAGLTAGKYTGNVKLSGTGASATIPVTVTVLKAPVGPVMDVNPTSLSFSTLQAGINPLPQLLSVKNTNPTSTPANLTFSVASDQSWLTATCTECTTPESVSVNVDAGTLAAGTYTGNVTITSTVTGTTTLNSPWKVPVTFTLLAAAPVVESHPDLRRGVIYQIVTDRFFDGDSTNNNPASSPNLYDASRTNWQNYWGGDLAGIQMKIAYLKAIGVSAIWISPPVDNIDHAVSYGSSNYAPYHSYWARDFKRIEEHFGDLNNTWAGFDNLVSTAHAAGIKVIVDFAANHTNPIRNFPPNNGSGGEDGVLYDNGALVTSYANDAGSSCGTGFCFHHNSTIADFNDRYQVQYYTLADLADLNQENPWVDQYLKDSVTQFIQHGVDGFRLDAVKHVNWGWEYTLSNSAQTHYTLESMMAAPTNPATGVAALPPFLFGEWAEGIGDSLYPDSTKFANNSGISLLDYPLYWDASSAFSQGGSFNTVDNDITKEDVDFANPNDLVTFVDNHDNPRLLSKGATQNQLNEALAFLLTCRGVPIVYYGDEQYLHSDTNGGGDPYTRAQMTTFDTTAIAARVVRYLAALRSKNIALAYGSMLQRWISNDIYVYERRFNDSIVLVAINKNETTPQALGGPWNTALPDGTYTDYLGGLLGGVSLTASGGAVANNAVTLPAHSVSVWQVQGAAAAQAGALTPTHGQASNRVAVTGIGFGTVTGTVNVGGTSATVVAWADDTVLFDVPVMTAGSYTVTLTPNGGSDINAPGTFTVLDAPQIPVTITAQNVPAVASGEQVMMTGDVVELGSNSTTFQSAIGPLLLPPGGTDYFITTSLPSGATVHFQFFKLNSGGAVSASGATTNTYTVPASGEGTVAGSW